MRSLNYVAAALLPVINSAYAGKGYDEGTVIVTQTRTITYCPAVLDWNTCDDFDYPSTTITRTGAPPVVTTTTSTSSKYGDGTTTTSYKDGDGTTTTSYKDGDGTTTTSYKNGDGTTTTSYKDGEGSTTTSYKDGEGSTTSGYGNGTTTTTTTSYKDGEGSTTTTSPGTIITTTTTSSGNDNGNGTTTTTSSTTTTGCFNSTRTASPFDFGRGIADRCNDANSRSDWCDGKSVMTDTDTDYHTGKVRQYRLEIGLGSVDADGNGAIPVFTINGKTPGDPIVANWGDEVEVTVVNVMDPSSGPVNATTIHWHGILQHGTNDQDGVPGVTQCGIAPGSSKVYRWHASTYGTSWYHGHLLAQYGGGVRGPIIIHGPATADYDLDMGSIMMDEKFAGSIFSTSKLYADGSRKGVQTATNYLLNGKNAHPSDPNKGEAARWIVKSGKKHLFRIINSSAQSGFVLQFDHHKMTVISADMTPIQPYETENLYIHSGQRYMVIVKADQPVAAYDVRAIVQKGCGTSIANDGRKQSNGIMEYEGSCYSVPAANNATIVDTTGVCKDELLSTLKPIVSKSAGSKEQFLSTAKNLPGGNTASVNFESYGLINRWYFGSPTDLTSTSNGTASAVLNVTFDSPTLERLPTITDYSSKIYGNTVFLNETNVWVYFVIQNDFITSHPMHLHGHDFSVLGQEYNKYYTAGSPLNFDNPLRRDTVLLYGAGGTGPTPAPRQPGYTVIGFQTNNPGAWVMHCHIIWHAELGMGLQFVEGVDEILKKDYHTKPEFQSECSAMKDYEAGASGRVKAQYESGLKVRQLEEVNRRHLEEHKFHGYAHGHAVRHA